MKSQQHPNQTNKEIHISNENTKQNMAEKKISMHFETESSLLLTSPRILKRDDLPQPFGPQTRTFIPDLTSKFSSRTRTSPLGVTRGTFSKRITLSSLMTLPEPGIRGLPSTPDKGKK